MKRHFRPVVVLLVVALIGVLAKDANAVPMTTVAAPMRPQSTVHSKPSPVRRLMSVTRVSRLKTKRSAVASGERLAKLTKKKARAKKSVPERINWLWHAPPTALPALAAKQSGKIKRMFDRGKGFAYSPTVLLAAKVFLAKPLVGGIFKRTGTVKYIIIHSTETATEADATRVVRSWNNRGLRHPGAQFIVERDGTIYQTVDPAMGTVHVNSSRTRYGVTNDNSVGIEIVRACKQKYSPAQKASVVRLVVYLQERFRVADQAVMGHGYVQPSNRTDPVGFDWQGFHQLVAAIKPDYRIANGGKSPVPAARTHARGGWGSAHAQASS